MQYIDLNYVLGKGSSGEPGYDTPESILQQMDYLDIDRAVVFSAEARDWSGINGNHMLLDSLRPYMERLKPAFIITPRDYYEKGTMEYYQSMAANGTVRMFRIVPGKTRTALYECEFVLEALANFPITVQIDSRELKLEDYRTLAELANKFPAINFLLGQKIWCNMESVFNLMKRCKNVLLDTSWLHVRNTIETAVELFGFERLLFATGHKNQYGASIAALNHAELSPEAREAIAHGNAERLMGLAPLAEKLSSPPEILKSKPLWQKFASGESLNNLDIIDAHVHQAPPAALGYLQFSGDVANSVPEMVKSMDKFGIAHSIVMGSRALGGNNLAGNREFAQQARLCRDRIHGYFVFNPRQSSDFTEEILEDFFADGFFAGFKTLSGYWKVQHNDQRYKLMWEFAEKHRLPILIHTWNDVEPLREVAAAYPHAKLIIAHCGGGDSGRMGAISLAEDFSNVYLEICGTFTASLPLAEAIEKLGNTRFIFGTDAALHDIAYEMGAFLSLPLPDETLLPIMNKNFRNICNITL